MSDHKSEVLNCSEPSCKAVITRNAWTLIKADDWFFQRNGDCWCPEHIPDWVPEWRMRQLMKGDK